MNVLKVQDQWTTRLAMTRQQTTSGLVKSLDTPSAGTRKVMIQNLAPGGPSCHQDASFTLVGGEIVMKHRFDGIQTKMARTMATEPWCARRARRRRRRQNPQRVSGPETTSLWKSRPRQ